MSVTIIIATVSTSGAARNSQGSVSLETQKIALLEKNERGIESIRVSCLMRSVSAGSDSCILFDSPDIRRRYRSRLRTH
jgi:hypothetical protein